GRGHLREQNEHEFVERVALIPVVGGVVERFEAFGDFARSPATLGQAARSITRTSMGSRVLPPSSPIQSRAAASDFTFRIRCGFSTVRGRALKRSMSCWSWHAMTPRRDSLTR